MHFPLLLVLACTTHKVQGLSVDCGAITFSLQRRYLIKAKCMLD